MKSGFKYGYNSGYKFLHIKNLIKISLSFKYLSDFLYLVWIHFQRIRHVLNFIKALKNKCLNISFIIANDWNPTTPTLYFFKGIIQLLLFYVIIFFVCDILL